MSFVLFQELGAFKGLYGGLLLAARGHREEAMDDVKGYMRHIHSASCRGGWGWEEWRHVLKTPQ